MPKIYPLGRIPSPFDARDYNLKKYIPMALPLKAVTEMKWEFPAESLNQGDTPHCVGFSMADFGINLPTNTPYTNEDGHNFYYQCKIIEGEPNQENGATIRAAAKVFYNLGKIDAYAFAPDMETIKYWLLNKGCLIAGTIWTMDMFEPDINNVVHITGDIVGGHAYLLNEWRADGYIGFQNSWGKDWGKNGSAYISAEDFERIFIFNGEAVTAVETIPPLPDPTNKGCLLSLWEKIKSIV